jgi:MFS family permease
VPESPRPPLSIPVFRAIWLAATVSWIGSFVQDVAERWIMLELTKSPLPSAMLSTVFVTASLLAMMPAGILADTYDRRTLIIISQIVQGVVAAIVAALTWSGHLTPALLLSAAAIMGVGMAVGNPAFNTLIPELVSRESVAEAIALVAVAFNIARAVGPAIGGVVLSTLGATASFAINAASFVAVVIAVIASRSAAVPKPPPEKSTLASAFSEPLAHALRHVGTRATILSMMTFTAGASIVYALMPAYGKTTLGASAREYGLMFGAMGLGAIAGTWALRPVRRRVAPRIVIVGTTLVYAASAIAMSRVEDVRVATLLFLPAGAGWTGTFSSFSTLVQMWTPDRLRARVVALYVVFHFATWAIGSTIGGTIADRWSVRLAMAIGAAITALATLVVSRVALPLSFLGPVGSIRRGQDQPPPDLDGGPVSTRTP